MNLMKAIICPRYGPPEILELQHVEKPTPRDNEILIKIYATTVVLGDCELRGFNFPVYSLGMKLLVRLGFGVLGPRKKILGQQCSGVVEEIGAGVTRFKPGDQVYAATGFNLGTYAEYTTMSETGSVTMKPKNMSFEEASTIPVGGSEALHFMREADIKQGQRVLINGAGGSIGTIAIQIAKSLGAEVTAVDSAAKFEMLQSIGADHLIDYKQENFNENGETYDVLFDIVGVTRFPDCLGSLNEGGTYLQGNGSISGGDKSLANKSGMRAVAGPADYNADNLERLRDIIEEGTIKTVIDRTYSLEDMVEVHKFVEQGGKKGNVVVTIADSN